MTDTATDKAQLAQKIKESANQIWLAGLGAYAKTGKEGLKLFEMLVHEGKEAEDFTKKKASEITEEASVRWNKFETTFDERVKAALGRIGFNKKQEDVKTDISELTQQISELSEAVATLAVKEKKTKSSSKAS